MPAQYRFAIISILSATTVFGLLVLSSAVASPRGGRSDQQIAFSRYDSAIGGFALWTARADGSRQVRRTLGQTYFPAWSPDRPQHLFDFPDDHGNEQIGQVNRTGFDFRQLTSLPGISEIADYLPDRKRIIFGHTLRLPGPPDWHTSVWVMQAGGRDPHSLIEASAAPQKVDEVIPLDWLTDHAWQAALWRWCPWLVIPRCSSVT